MALGKGLFAGPAVPSALCREFPLGTAYAERICASSESKVLSAEPWNPAVNMAHMFFRFWKDNWY
jgi:hypothetical protein